MKSFTHVTRASTSTIRNTAMAMSRNTTTTNDTAMAIREKNKTSTTRKATGRRPVVGKVENSKVRAKTEVSEQDLRGGRKIRSGCAEYQEQLRHENK